MIEGRHLLDVVAREQWINRSADVLAAAIEAAVASRERCLLALSGGSSPSDVFSELATRDLPWEKVTFCQVDDRIVPLDSSARHLLSQRAILGNLGASWLPLPVDELLPLRGEQPIDHEAPALISPDQARHVLDRYAEQLVNVAGQPPVFDVIHLGLGADGHTASLVPGDPLVDELGQYVGITGLYSGSPLTETRQGVPPLGCASHPSSATQRVTLTRAVLDRARMVLWLVRGQSKAPALAELVTGTGDSPASKVHAAHSVIVADESAASLINRQT